MPFVSPAQLSRRSLEAFGRPASPGLAAHHRPSARPADGVEVTPAELGAGSTYRATDVRECAFIATAISALSFFRSVGRSLRGISDAAVAVALHGGRGGGGGGEIIWSVMRSHCMRAEGGKGRPEDKEGGREERGEGGGASIARPAPASAPHNHELRPREQSFTSRSTADKKGLRERERARHPGRERERGRE